MRTFSARERAMVVALVVVGMVAVFWFFPYSGLREERSRLQGELTQKQTRLIEYRQLAAEREQLERDYRARQDRIRTIEAKLPPEREIPTLLRQMQAVAAQSGVKMVMLRPGPLESPPTAPGAGAGTGGSGAGEGVPPPPPEGQAPGAPRPAAQPPYRLFRVDLGFEGTYATLHAFLQRLENFPRFIAMTQVTMTVVELPRLRLSVVSSTFVLPNGGQP